MTSTRLSGFATNADGELTKHIDAEPVASSISGIRAVSPVWGRIDRRRHRAGWLLLLLLFLTAGFLLGQARIEERWSTHRWGVVVPGRVYRSGQISRYHIEETLRAHRIATVIDFCGFERHNADQLVEMAVAEYHNIDHHRFPLAGDGLGDINTYLNAVELIARREREGKPVLVHCAAGTYRTGGVVAVYRLLVRGDSPASVREEMTAYGYSPTDSRPKLVHFINANMAFFAKELTARKILDRVPDELPQLRP